MRIDSPLVAVRVPPPESMASRTEAIAVREPDAVARGSRASRDSPVAEAVPMRVSSLRAVIGDVDIRNLTPRRMVDLGMDLYVAGVLPWEDYAQIAFQPELHPDYDRTIGALTGEKAAPDRPRDFLAQWEDRLRFDRKYNADRQDVIACTERIVGVFRQIEAPTHFFA